MSLFEELGVQKEVPLCQGIVRYRECGSGEPIVFVHGLLVNGDVWRKVVPTLAQRYRCTNPGTTVSLYHSRPPVRRTHARAQSRC